MATDPRLLKGGIAGPGGPHDRGSVVLDAERAVLLSDVTVCSVDTAQAAQVLAMQLSGRINHSRDQAEVLFLFDAEGAAAIVTELLALAARMDASGLRDLIVARIELLADADALGGDRG